jgi:hypothetical protein
MTFTIVELEQIYGRLYQSLDPRRGAPAVTVEFYPYVGMNSRIRMRDGRLKVRLSDLLEDAPAEFHNALAVILIHKLFRKRVPAGAQAAYVAFAGRPDVHEKSVQNRRERGRKVVSDSRGEFYDLEAIFDCLNLHYFEGRLEKPTLSWSARKTFRILGHHDSVHDTIVISRSLDQKKIPAYVVEFVLYHEMLHIAHPTKMLNGRRYNHTAAFRRDERRFTRFLEAETWINTNVASIKRKVKRERRVEKSQARKR